MSLLPDTWWARRSSRHGLNSSDKANTSAISSPESLNSSQSRISGPFLGSTLAQHIPGVSTFAPHYVMGAHSRNEHHQPFLSETGGQPFGHPVNQPTTWPRSAPGVVTGRYGPAEVHSQQQPLVDAPWRSHPVAMDFGLIHNLILDPTVEEIWINSPQKVFVSRNGRTELTNVLMTPELVENLVERCLMWGGRRLDRSHPFVDARLPDGSRLHVAIPDVTAEHWAVNIRKHLMNGKNLQDLSAMGSFPTEVANILREIVNGRKNILVSGSTQAGKTTLLNALIAEIPQYERVITIEEVFELRCVLPDVVSLQTRSASLEGTGEITLRELIKESLRMRPSRLVVGEIREAESLDLLIALNSGIPGMATIHGNSARDAIRKLQTLPLLAGENISADFIAPTVARSINYVIHVGIDAKTGQRSLREISEVTGRLEGQVLEMHHIYHSEQQAEILH